MEFGWINVFNGIIIGLLLIPNIYYVFKRHDTNKSQANIASLIIIFEQIGRYACMFLMIVPLLVNKFGFNSALELIVYLLINGLLIIVYYCAWVKYLKNNTKKSAYILAIVPTIIFMITGLLLRHWLLFVASIIFGVTHTYITNKDINGLQ